MFIRMWYHNLNSIEILVCRNPNFDAMIATKYGTRQNSYNVWHVQNIVPVWCPGKLFFCIVVVILNCKWKNNISDPVPLACVKLESHSDILCCSRHLWSESCGCWSLPPPCHHYDLTCVSGWEGPLSRANAIIVGAGGALLCLRHRRDVPIVDDNPALSMHTSLTPHTYLMFPGPHLIGEPFLLIWRPFHLSSYCSESKSQKFFVQLCIISSPHFRLRQNCVHTVTALQWGNCHNFVVSDVTVSLIIK